MQPFPSRPVRRRAAASGWVISCLLMSALFAASAETTKSGKRKGEKRKAAAAAAAASATPGAGEQSLSNIPLPIGHDAKGLVLPDFDADGRLRGKFVAGAARRIDQDHINFNELKIITYTEGTQVDLEIEMLTSTFDLTTRILSSDQRTTVRRADFNIVGDSAIFDTNARTSRIVGNVKMVITDSSHMTEKPKR